MGCEARFGEGKVGIYAEVGSGKFVLDEVVGKVGRSLKVAVL